MSALKKAVKKIGRFVKKHAKKILIAAAVVFTAGIASIGAAGFGAAATAAGGGISGTLVAIGSTLKAGVVAIGGALGIGKGAAAASTAAGTAAGGAGSAVGAMGSVGASLAGAAAPAAGINAGAYLAGSAIPTLGAVTAVGTAPAAAAGLGALGSTAVAAGTSAAASAMTAKPSVSQVDVPAQERLAYQPPSLNAPPTAPEQSLLGKVGTGVSNFLKRDGVSSALVSGGLNAMSSYMAAKAQEEDEAINALYGVSPRDGDTSLTPDQVRFATAPENKNSWRPRLMYDA